MMPSDRRCSGLRRQPRGANGAGATRPTAPRDVGSERVGVPPVLRPDAARRGPLTPREPGTRSAC